jgi:thioredoxin 1
MKIIPLLVIVMCVASLSFAQSKIDAAFAWDNNFVYFIKGNKVAKYDNAQNNVVSTVSLSEAFSGIPFNSVDAALNYGNDKIFFFSGSEYARYDKTTHRMDPNYPKNITKYWEGIEFDRIDAAITWSNGKTYFFHQGSYTRYDNSDEMVDDGYPKGINDQTWPGVNFSSIDASINLSGDKTYFFKGDQYVRFDEQNDRVDPGYPKALSKWGGLIEALGGSNRKPEPKPEPTADGIDFLEGSWSKALSKAKTSGKLIFVDAYTTWCGPCKRMSANVFPNNSVGKLYNKNFINVKMDMERGDGPAFGRKYEINAYPSLLFIDGNGKLIKKVIGGQDVEGFLNLGKKVSKYTGGANGGNNNGNSRNNNGNNNGGDKTSYGSFKVNKKSIDLSPYKADSPSSVLADFKLKKGYNGINFLSIQKEHDAIIFKINSTGDRIGAPIVLAKYWMSDMYPMEDGSLVVIAKKSINNTYIDDYPNTIHFLRISANGAVSSPKHILGGEGHGTGKSWFDGRSEGRITYNRTNFGIHFEVQKNWAKAGEKDDIHNGDMFVVTDKNGNKDESKSHFWTASHSNTVQSAAMTNGEFWTMTIGDAHPFGLQV